MLYTSFLECRGRWLRPRPRLLAECSMEREQKPLAGQTHWPNSALIWWALRFHLQAESWFSGLPGLCTVGPDSILFDSTLFYYNLFYHIIYKKQQYDKYVKKSLDSDLLPRLNSQNKEYLSYKNNFLTRKKDMENRYEKYKNNFYSSQNMKSVKRTTSIIPITYGFGVLSVSSVFSAIFSIERNTRKDKSD